MGYSEKLNGFWEEGYHYYFEIRDDKLTVREYRRKVELETTISYDPDSIEAGKKTPITLADNVISYNGYHEPMSLFEEFWYENGEIHLVKGDTYSDNKRLFVMKKVNHGPFDHIIIRDDEYRERLQGEWRMWRETGKYDKKWDELVIEGDSFRWRLHSGRFHVISYNRDYDKDSVYLVPWDLTENSFSGCTKFQVYPDMLTTHETICDMSTPLSVFAREEDLDKIEVPAGAKTGYTSYGPMITGGPMMGFQGLLGMAAKWKCSCGAENSGVFCARCGKVKMVTEATKETWKCSCGKENDGKFCRDCGKPKPMPKPVKEIWKCSCGKENDGKFCRDCGKPKPMPKPARETWKCSCGTENAGKFCAGCGNPKPEPVKETWKCSCGTENEGKFCSWCAAVKPVDKEEEKAETAGAPIEPWSCSCGATGLTTKFCPSCGYPRPEAEEKKS